MSFTECFFFCCIESWFSLWNYCLNLGLFESRAISTKFNLKKNYFEIIIKNINILEILLKPKVSL